MAITAIQQFLKPDRPKPSDFIRVMQMLLHGVSLHAAEGTPEELNRFRSEINGVSNGLSDKSSFEEILVAVGSVTHALEEHNRGSSAFLKAQMREMQAMLAMMSNTIAFLASSSKAGVQQLQTLEGQLEEAGGIDDVRLLRLRLEGCLATVRTESSRLRDESESQLKLLKEGLEQATAFIHAVPGSVTDHAPAARKHIDPDRTTGLQPRQAAEDKVASIVAGGKASVIVIFLVDRLASLNARFGRKVGDEVLLLVAQHLSRSLPAKSPPFRWSGPSFVAFINEESASVSTRLQVKKITSTKLEKTFDASGRSALLPISCSAVLQGITPDDSAEDVFDAIDRFVASYGGEAPPMDR